MCNHSNCIIQAQTTTLGLDMSYMRAGLSGLTFEKFDNVEFMYFTEDEFNRWFEMKEADVRREIALRLKATVGSELELPNDIPFDGQHRFLLLQQANSKLVYGWTHPHGSHPMRWEQREDLTDFMSSL